MTGTAGTAVAAGRTAAPEPSPLASVRRAQLRRSGLVVALLLVATSVVFCVGVAVGDYPVAARDVVPAIFGLGNPDATFIVQTLRLPRALTGLLVGLAFGCSGAIFQSLARNPLASPDIIGLTEGASFAAVLAIVLTPWGELGVSVAAVAGALVAATAVYLLAYRRGITSYRLILVGIGVGAVLASGTAYLLTRARIFEAEQAEVWLTGSLFGRTWGNVRVMALTLLVLGPLVALLMRPLRILQLGDEVATGLGLRVEGIRTSLVATGVGLAAMATAAAGPVTFVAFVSPAIARRMTRDPGACLLPSTLAGGLLVAASDLVARRVLAPGKLPVGIVTALVGAPYLLWLLARTNRSGSGG